MNLQVLPLKILATRQVVMDRMDYSTYLTGITKEELDRLDMLAGDFRVKASKLTIDASYNGQRLPTDDWKYLKSSFKLPTLLIKIIEGIEDFSIIESKSGQRNWAMRDVWWKSKMLKDRGELNFSSKDSWDRWDYGEDFIEDGKLVNLKKKYKLDNGRMILTLDFRDSFTADKDGNIIWNLMWSAPHRDIKVTKVVRAVRIQQPIYPTGYLRYFGCQAITTNED